MQQDTGVSQSTTIPPMNPLSSPSSSTNPFSTRLEDMKSEIQEHLTFRRTLLSEIDNAFLSSADYLWDATQNLSAEQFHKLPNIAEKMESLLSTVVNLRNSTQQEIMRIRKNGFQLTRVPKQEFSTRSLGTCSYATTVLSNESQLITCFDHPTYTMYAESGSTVWQGPARLPEREQRIPARTSNHATAGGTDTKERKRSFSMISTNTTLPLEDMSKTGGTNGLSKLKSKGGTFGSDLPSL